MRNQNGDLRAQYLNQLLPTETEAMTLAKSKAAIFNKSFMSVSAHEGHMLGFLAKAFGCRKFVEIGTFTGYSALWINQGLGEGGQLYTLEKDPVHVAAAQEVFAFANLGSRVEVVIGDAVETLKKLATKGPFDGVFIDGNKSAYLEYLDWALSNVKAGGIIISDNVFLAGTVYNDGLEGPFSDKQIEVMREFNRRLFTNPQLESIIIPTAEGLALSIRV